MFFPPLSLVLEAAALIFVQIGSLIVFNFCQQFPKMWRGEDFFFNPLDVNEEISKTWIVSSLKQQLPLFPITNARQRHVLVLGWASRH